MHQKWFKTFYLVASNVSFLFPSLFALASNYYAEAAIYTSISIISSLYHLCKEDWIDAAGDGGFCLVLNFDQFKALDFFFAQMIVPITLLYFISFDAIVDRKKKKIVSGDRKWLEILLLYWYAFFNAFTLLADNDFILNVIILGSSTLTTVILITLIIYIKYDGLLVKFYPTELALGLFFSFFAISFMFLQDRVSDHLYWFIHASWHILGSLSQWFLMISKKETSASRNYYDETRPLLLMGGGDSDNDDSDDDNSQYAFYSYMPLSKRTGRRSSRLPYYTVFREKLRNLKGIFSWTTPTDLKE